jgi:metallo-beta-lactamase family protein
MNITFWGATQDVTGSMSIVQFPEGKILVDAGMNQGDEENRELNRLAFPFDASEIKAIVLTHAHLDHSGLLPSLIKKGFSGPIYCTLPTSKLAKIILEDSSSLNKESLYNDKDVTKTVNLFHPIDWNKTFFLLGGSLKLIPAGHILGAASVELQISNKTLVLSGDLGRQDDPLIPGPPPCPETNAVVMEATYGGKERQGDLKKELHSLLTKIHKDSRVGIIASFAIARGQLLITLINEFFEKNPDKRFRVVMDSPMMSEANRIYKKYAHLTKMPHLIQNSIGKIESIEFQRQWESLRRKEGPLLIISSSGMLTGGRINRHINNWQDDEKAILFLPGYQAKGTPGRHFVEGYRELLGPDDERILWQGEVLASSAFSSHADQKELTEWVRNVDKDKPIYLVHGEIAAKMALKEKLESYGHQKVILPKRGESFEI